jgi:hypothetical protein
MPAILLKFLGPAAPYLAIAGALLGVAFYIFTLRHELAAADDKNIALQQANQANAAAIAAYKTAQANDAASLAALDAQTLKTNTATGRIMDSINAAEPGNDAPVAPVLAQALGSLRALHGGAP